MKDLGLTSEKRDPLPKVPPTARPSGNDRPYKVAYKEKQQVQVWSQSEAEWMDAVVQNVYQDGAVGVTYLDKPANKVIPAHSLEQWVRVMPYHTVKE